MKIGYGISVQESDDPYISIAEEALNGAAQAGIPGAFWVDFLPLLKYVPSWFPGAGFQKKAARWRRAINAMTENPFSHVQEQLVIYNVSFFFFFGERAHEHFMILKKMGDATPSVAESIIKHLPNEGDPQRSMEETIAKGVLLVAYAGMWCT